MFLQKYCVRFNIPRIVNNCTNSIFNKINTHSCYSGYIKTHFLQTYKGKLHYSGMLCMQSVNLVSHNFYLHL